MADRCSDAVRAGVTTANDDDMFAVRHNWFDCTEFLTSDTAVLLRQEVHGVVNTGQITAFNRKITGVFCTTRDDNRVIFIHQVLGGDIDTHIRVVVEGDAFTFHLLNTPVDMVLFHLEVWNAIAKQATGLCMLFKKVHVIACLCQLLSTGHAGRAGSDDGDFLAQFAFSWLGCDPTFFPAPVDNRTFDRFDRHGFINQI